MTVENSTVEAQRPTPDSDQAADTVKVDPILDGEQIAEEQVEADVAEQADSEPEVDAAVERILELEDQLAQKKDQMLRVQAEMMNIKRRAEQDVEKAHKFALEKFVNELIPVVESLEKGIETATQADGAHAGMLEGMKLTLKQLLSAMAKFEVAQVNPEGEPFDPNFHQAISMVPNPDMEPNTVMTVFQKGYTLHGRVIRPAMVVVSN